MSRFPDDPILTNSRLYRDIASEALTASEAAAARGQHPKGDGSPGHVLVYDPQHRSFKHSMIAIVFAGMYIEAQLWLFGSSRIGSAKYKPIDKKPIEERLPALGVSDQMLRAELKNYRETRRSLVHEKPVPLSMDTSPIRIAQAEAAKAVALMYRVEKALAVAGDLTNICSRRQLVGS